MAKRYYIIPMAYPATEVEKELPNFATYGVSMLDIFGSVWRSIMEDDKRYHLDVSNYIARVIRQQWHDNRILLHGSSQAMQNEIDEMTRKCIEVCDEIHDHVLKFMDIIQSVEIREAPDDNSYWSIYGLDGVDVIILCEDPVEPRKLTITDDVEIVQLK